MAVDESSGGTDAARARNRIGRGIITLGFGAEKYRRMAVGLARSIRLVDDRVRLAVVTDHLDDEELRRHFDILVPFEPDYGEGVFQKLWLDCYTPFRETLYVDADSLVAKPLEPVFALMGIGPFGAVGFPVVDGFYWAEVTDLMERFGVPFVGRFNAGLMYFDVAGDEVFRTARKIADEDGMAGLPRYRGAVLDEIPLAVALGRLGIAPVFDDGKVMRAPEPLESRFVVDIRRGVGRFKSKGRWVEPAVLHFAYLYHGCGVRGSVYRRELLRLEGRPLPLAERLRCAVAQTVFTLEASPAVRTIWKSIRGRVRKLLGLTTRR